MSGAESCDIEIIDRTQSFDSKQTAELSELCCFSLEAEQTTQHWTVALVLTDDEEIARLHQEFMGIAGPTDILTFADDESPSGDIVISVDQANRQRHDDDWSLIEELRFLVVHGILHLTGWDDATPALRSAMLDRQREIIRQFQTDSSSAR